MSTREHPKVTRSTGRGAFSSTSGAAQRPRDTARPASEARSQPQSEPRVPPAALLFTSTFLLGILVGAAAVLWLDDRLDLEPASILLAMAALLLSLGVALNQPATRQSPAAFSLVFLVVLLFGPLLGPFVGPFSWLTTAAIAVAGSLCVFFACCLSAALAEGEVIRFDRISGGWADGPSGLRMNSATAYLFATIGFALLLLGVVAIDSLGTGKKTVDIGKTVSSVLGHLGVAPDPLSLADRKERPALENGAAEVPATTRENSRTAPSPAPGSTLASEGSEPTPKGKATP